MLSAVADTSFGNRGALWSGVPYLWKDPSPPSIYSLEDETHYMGGTAVGLHLLSSGSACAVVWGWDFLRPWESNYLRQPPAVRLVIFPPDGRSNDGRWNAAQVVPVSESGTGATPLASCTTPDGYAAVLIRSASLVAGGAKHQLCSFNPAHLGVVRREISPSDLSYGTLAQNGSVRIAANSSAIAIASSNGPRIRLALVPSIGSVSTRDVDLSSNNNMLPGLLWLDLAGLRFDAGMTVISMTAHLNHPGIGGTTVAAILRLRPDGSRETSFGNNGLWISPLSPYHRDLVCAGEFGGIVAGCVGRRAVLFAIDRNDISGEGLDFSFGGGNGFVEHNLGGPLSTPVALSDKNAVYLFAQRVPTQADQSGDLRTVGCRFNTNAPAFGVVEQGFGTAGTVTIWSDGAAFSPVGIASASQIVLGGTRSLVGTDCDRVPTVVTMSPTDGDPSPAYGFGGFSLHASVGPPVYIAPDGSSVFAERSKTSTAPTLRFVSPSGEIGPRVPLTPIYDGATISSIVALPDGSLLVTGSRTITGTGMPAWVVKLTPTRAIDTSFGTAGVFHPTTDADDTWALGVRADNKIALQIYTAGVGSRLAIMLTSGQLDTSFGVNGFAPLDSFLHPGVGVSYLTCFLDEDDAVICVAHSSHVPSEFTSPFVKAGLRRITPTGAYDATFGLGIPSVNPPASTVVATLGAPSGSNAGRSEYSGVSPRAIWRAGGQLYLFAVGTSGGGELAGRPLPSYPVFLVFRWNANGSRDLTFFATGWQEAGFSPDTVYWSPRGVLKHSANTAIVYGMAGAVDEVQKSVGGVTYTDRIIREPKPALFKFDHPNGLDLSFGVQGAARFPTWEQIIVPLGGALLSNGRVRIACVDVLTHPRSRDPQHNFAGLLQWQLVDTLSGPLPPLGPRWRRWLQVIILVAILAGLIYVLMK